MTDEASVRVLREHRRLDAVTAEFLDPALEARFWATVTADPSRRRERIAGAGVLLYLSMTLTDLVSLGLSSTYLWLLVIRLAGALPALGFLLALRRWPALICNHALVTALGSGLLLSWIVIALRLPDVGSTHHLSVGLIGLAVFVLVPNRVLYAVVSVGGCFTFWLVAHAVVRGVDPSGDALGGALVQTLSFATCLVVGWASTTAIGAAQRDAFLLLTWEREANGQLTTEIERRKVIERSLLERANIDPLTAVPSRRYFLERAELEFGQARRSRDPVALLLVDLDHFKSVNDHHGHAAGDQVLRLVSRAFRDHVRTVDVIGRLGGEEFAIMMPGADQVLAGEAAERLRRQVAMLTASLPTGEVRPTISIGVIACDVWTETVSDALQRADIVMYEAKTGGRDRVVSG